jgi:hypothetical protein
VEDIEYRSVVHELCYHQELVYLLIDAYPHEQEDIWVQ